MHEPLAIVSGALKGAAGTDAVKQHLVAGGVVVNMRHGGAFPSLIFVALATPASAAVAAVAGAAL